MKKDPLGWAHPLVKEWLIQKYGAPTEPQIQGWPAILAGQTTLISAPTGSGKTLAAFLTCIDHLVRKALSNQLNAETEVLYVSPLKALSNDVQKNLLEPLHEIAALAKKQNLQMAEINVAVRTGDTLPRERQAMLKNPPHILVTTPESLYILITAEKSRVMLRDVKTIIVDEIHALVNDKRGAHLALSLERLEALTTQNPIRVGLSATQKPIEMVAQFLTGNQRPIPTIVNIGHIRELDLAIEVPQSELGPIASNEMWDEIYDRIATLANENRSTLIFVNTRRLAERVAHHLAERLGEEQVTAHHGSLSRKLRHRAETKLKNGELKALVATASLELGIDIGSVDLVCQVGSPRAIAVALQRVGRAGHWHGAISKGRFFVTTRDELMECAALVYAIQEGDLDKLIIPKEPLDVLSQQIVAACVTNEWPEEDLYQLVKRAYPYTDLSRDTFNHVLTMLSEGIAGSRGRYGSYLFRDQVNHIVKAKRGARLTAITNGGAIPENGLFTVIAEPNGVMVGTLDEDFAVESNRGDIILLGTTSWIIKRIESASGKVLVEDAHGAPPSVPFWRGEAPGRTNELSSKLSLLREKVNELLPANIAMDPLQKDVEWKSPIEWLKKHCALDQTGAEQFIEYLLQGRAILGAVPTKQTIIAERFFDEAGGMQLIIHAPFGARINKAWGLALRKRFCRSFNFELQAAATDNGLNIALAEQHSFPLSDVFHFLHPNTLKDVLIQAVLQSPLFATRWRWAATRALALVRYRGGKKIPPHIQRMLSDDLLAAVFPDAAACQDNLGGKEIELPSHILTDEAMKDALTEALDLEGLTDVIRDIVEGKLTCLAVDTPLPSPFAHEILNANPYAFLDDAPLEERRARAVELRRILPSHVSQEVGKLDLAAIEEVQQEVWPDIREPDELHDVLQSFIAFPIDASLGNLREIPAIWHDYFTELALKNRVGIAIYKNKRFWFAAEKAKTFTAIYPEAVIEHAIDTVEKTIPDREDAVLNLLRGWLFHLGPATSNELSEWLQLSNQDLEPALLKLESTGLILRGQFRTMGDDVFEWCERRLLARIHRLTVGRLRKEIEPVTAGLFVRWLMKWQHLAPGTQLRDEQGLFEIVQQMQGFEMPANAWEKQIFAKRMVNYEPGMLDQLCLTGAIGWGRLSPHPAINHEERKKQIRPSSVAPITFFVREQADWMATDEITKQDSDLDNLSHAAKSIYIYLEQKGASFFTEIAKGVHHLKSEIETGLWELAAAGLITADGFDNLRALIDPKRRSDKRRRHLTTRFTSGRWSLLHKTEVSERHLQLEAICWMLLRRYGVVFRDLLVREKNIPRWRDLLLTFRRLEDRGEIRGGRFVSGFLGEQFALPYAVDSLRAMRKQILPEDAVTFSAVDPLNLVGILLPGAKTSAYSGKSVTIEFAQNPILEL